MMVMVSDDDATPGSGERHMGRFFRPSVGKTVVNDKASAMDTDHFIIEVQSRPCLWNVKDKTHNNRDARRRAWEEIAMIFNEDWTQFSPAKQKETRDDLQKLWKNMKDYYIREKKRGSSGASGSSAKRKKKPPYFETLQFLDGVRDLMTSDGNNASDAVDQDVSQDSEQAASITQLLTSRNPCTFQLPSTSPQSSSSNNVSSSEVGKQTMTVFEEHLVRLMQKDHERSVREDDPNKCFLLSLLPEVESMTPSQQFDFKLQVMNVIKNIKYPPSIPPSVVYSPEDVKEESSSFPELS